MKTKTTYKGKPRFTWGGYLPREFWFLRWPGETGETKGLVQYPTRDATAWIGGIAVSIYFTKVKAQKVQRWIARAAEETPRLVHWICRTSEAAKRWRAQRARETQTGRRALWTFQVGAPQETGHLFDLPLSGYLFGAGNAEAVARCGARITPYGWAAVLAGGDPPLCKACIAGNAEDAKAEEDGVGELTECAKELAHVKAELKAVTERAKVEEDCLRTEKSALETVFRAKEKECTDLHARRKARGSRWYVARTYTTTSTQGKFTHNVRWWQTADKGSVTDARRAEVFPSSRAAWTRKRSLPGSAGWTVYRRGPADARRKKLRAVCILLEKEVDTLRDVVKHASTLTGFPGLGVQQGILEMKKQIENLNEAYKTLYKREGECLALLGKLKSGPVLLQDALAVLVGERFRISSAVPGSERILAHLRSFGAYLPCVHWEGRGEPQKCAYCTNLNLTVL